MDLKWHNVMNDDYHKNVNKWHFFYLKLSYIASKSYSTLNTVIGKSCIKCDWLHWAQCKLSALGRNSERTFYSNLNECLLHHDKKAVQCKHVAWFNLSLKPGVCKPLDPAKCLRLAKK